MYTWMDNDAMDKYVLVETVEELYNDDGEIYKTKITVERVELWEFVKDIKIMLDDLEYKD